MLSIDKFFVFPIIFLMVGCQGLNFSEGGAGVNVPDLDDRGFLVHRLSDHGVLNDQRLLTHLSHTCNLKVDGNRYPVVDVRELVPKGDSPRGLNRIVILNSSLVSLNMIEYVGSRPLFCDGNRLFLYDQIQVDGFEEPANVLTFDSWGAVKSAEHMSVNRW